MSDTEARLVQALQKLTARLSEAEYRRREPIAIVGLGCRFPEAELGPRSYWELLRAGKDASKEVTRWDPSRFYAPSRDVEGKSYTKRASLLSGIDTFEPSFFQISPREAEAMDPQQRIALEVAYEAISDAAIPIEVLQAGNTGVFLGVAASEYGMRFAKATAVETLQYTFTGNVASVVAGRISYVFDFKGPCMAIDTACSSSLVAIHAACESLRNRASDVAIAGGVSAVVSSDGFVQLSALGALAPDGRSKTWDASANGYGRGEGCGIVVLKRLSDAQRDGDRIWALLPATAINSDGHTSGLPAPNPAAQERVIRAALEAASLSPEAVQYIEAHGTGTVLGDPIEVEALSAVFGSRSGPPLALGTVKTNFGHLEAGSGVAGLIKAVLAIRNRQLPASLHFKSPNPHIAWSEIPIRVWTELGPWPSPQAPLVAGVSSFGVSGTNAHAIVTEAPKEPAERIAEADAEAAKGDPLVLTLSAKTPEALAAYATRYAELLEGPPEEGATYRDVAYTSSVRQTHFEHRLAVVGKSEVEWAERLRAFTRGDALRRLVVGHASQRAGVVFVFAGQGSQWLGMGCELLDKEPVFREAIERCEAAMKPFVDWSLSAQLRASAAESRMDEIDVVQPMLFGMQVGLAALYRSWGVEPSAVVGHSMGEAGAAAVSGALSLEDAAKVLCVRSRLLRRMSGRGGMAIADLTMQEAEAELVKYGGALSVAANNGPRTTVVSGDTAAINAMVLDMEKRGVFCRAIKGTVASHSSKMDELKDELIAALGTLTPRTAEVRFISTADARETAPPLDARYWWTNLREPVRFAASVKRLQEDGNQIFVELSPHPVLITSIGETLSPGGTVIGSLRRQEPEKEAILEALGAIHCAGYPVEWKKQYPVRGRVVSLPSYPWQRERCWVDDESPQTSPVAASARQAPRLSPMLHRHIESPNEAGTHYFQLDLHDSPELTYLWDHQLADEKVFPASAYLELASEAGRLVGNQVGASVSAVRDVTLEEPLALDTTRSIQLVMRMAQDQRATCEIFSKPVAAGAGPVRHARGIVQFASVPALVALPTLQELRARCPRAVPLEGQYEKMAKAGGTLGPSFRAVSELHRGDSDALARLTIPADIATDLASHDVHPALLEACIEVVGGLFTGDVSSPIGFRELYVVSPGAVPAWAYVRSKGTCEVDAWLLDEQGRVIAQGLGITTAAVPKRDELGRWLYDVAWRTAAPASGKAKDAGGPWLILADRTGEASRLRAELEANGAAVVTVTAGREWARTDATHVTIDASSEKHFAKLIEEVYGSKPPKRIVQMWTIDAAPHDPTSDSLGEAHELGTLGTFHLAKAVCAMGWQEAPRLFLITRGAQPAGSAVESPDQAALWGSGAILAHEHPELETTLIDLDPSGTSTKALAHELTHADREDRIALRGDARRVMRLARRKRTEHAAVRLRGDRTYLVTGGCGGIGLVAARRLVESGARHLALMGRSAPKDDARARIAELEQLGARVEIIRGDVAKVNECTASLKDIASRMPPLAGIVHAAGVFDAASIGNVEDAKVRRVMAPKVLGGWNLHNLTKGAALDFFVSFGSGSAVRGAPGLGAYAAANAFLDGLAHFRTAQKLPGQTIDWCSWADVGMMLTLGKSSGEGGGRDDGRLLKSSEGSELFGRLLADRASQVFVFPPDLAEWPALEARGVGAPLEAELETKKRARATSKAAAEASAKPSVARPELVGSLLAEPPERRVPMLVAHLRKLFTELVGRPADGFSLEHSLLSEGMDSLRVVELLAALRRQLGLAFSPPEFFSRPTLGGFAAHVVGRVVAESPPAGAAPTAATAAGPTSLATTLLAETPEARTEQLVALLRKLFTEIVGRSAASFALDQSLLLEGVDSLRTVELLAALRKRLGLAFSPPEFFSRPTLGAFAAHVSARLGAAAPAAAQAAAPSAGSPPPLARTDAAVGSTSTFWQDVIVEWVRQRPRNGAFAFNYRLRITGALDAAKLKQAIVLIANRQDSLRQVFDRSEGGNPRACDPSEIELTKIDVRELTPAAFDALCHETADAGFPFDGTPLIRFFLFAHADNEHTLMMLCHFVVQDPVGAEHIMGEVLEAYASLVEGREPRLAPLPIRMVDYAVWERAWYAAGGRREVETVKSRIADAKPLALPTNKPRTGRVGTGIVSSELALSREDSERFAKVCDETGVTIFAGFVAVQCAMLARVCKQEDITVFSNYNTNWHPELKALVGKFGNWIPIRLRVGAEIPPRELLVRASEAVATAYAQGSAPARLVLDTPDMFGHPLCRATFNTPQVDFKVLKGGGLPEVPGLSFKTTRLPLRRMARTELIIHMLRIDGQVRAEIVGSDELFDGAAVEGWRDELGRVCADVLKT